ncbi:hypothetical protein M407DRAFT_24408 [Tulasnella calospora MUT 4182]|uniref:Uncharacterized protein n=1 Tax=Tulasnella calospora MUT 4182 TaxID=1051891 RepID=A0A0C3KY94_9AGAM|nr:hypothetical protein M407DRAFT_24408 [Tulasnella calospora MUT 4182]
MSSPSTSRLRHTSAGEATQRQYDQCGGIGWAVPTFGISRKGPALAALMT